MKVYYDKDANLENIRKLNVSIIGYGSQGHAHALNLRDSGVNVTVGLREGSSSANRAENEGLDVLPIESAVKKANIVIEERLKFIIGYFVSGIFCYYCFDHLLNNCSSCNWIIV